MKRSVRQHERAAVRADSSMASGTILAGYAAWRAYRDLRRQKRESFWLEKVESERSSPAQLWRSIDALMGRGRLPMYDTIGPNELHSFFDAKVAAVQAATADAPPPSFTASPPGCEFSQFRRVNADDVIEAVRALPDKQCSSDPLTTRLLKENIDVLAPLIVELF